MKDTLIIQARWSRRIIANTIFSIQVFFFFILAAQCAVYATGQLAPECMVLHVLGYFQKKSKQYKQGEEGGGRGGAGVSGLSNIYISSQIEDIFFWKPTWNFSFFYFTTGNSRQNKAQPLDIPQNCVRSLLLLFLEIPQAYPRPKTKTPGSSTAHYLFLGHPWKFHFIFN